MIRSLLIGVIRLYQWTLSPLFGTCCRFYPSCSAYWIEAVRVHGAMKGSLLGIRRLTKCHPFYPGGVDLVPRHGRINPACGRNIEPRVPRVAPDRRGLPTCDARHPSFSL